MKIAVTSSGPTLDDMVEQRFGRCPYFLIIDPDTLEYKPIQNPNVSLGGGAGPQSAQLMANEGVSAVLTGNCGPNAFQTFGAAGIKVITGVGGPVRQAVEQYKTGALAHSSEPSVQSHFGMGGGGMGRGMGMGGGRGMGGGMGGGMGRGMGMGRGGGMGGFSQPADIPPVDDGPASKKDELARLKEAADSLRRQVQEIEAKIKDMDENQ